MAAHSTPLAKSLPGRKAKSISSLPPTRPMPRRKVIRTKTSPQFFEYPCAECGRGTVRTTRVRNYKTKIKGFPFRVDEALIGVCDHCQAESFAPEETRRWEAAFQQTLEARQAFLTPAEIRTLRMNMNLSLEDFARLIGCTRQSVMAWEHPERTTPPSRMADLMLRLLQRSWTDGAVDVTALLVDEAKKWGVMMELRRPTPLGETPRRAAVR
jgi:putative zinc finger/helix-turn-helix YgiT family protein